eukprot:6212371-Pleurochrysis_carterae.AAC.5
MHLGKCRCAPLRTALHSLALVSLVYLARARPVLSEFQSRERMADVAVPCTPNRRPPAGTTSPRACDRSRPHTSRQLRRAWSQRVGLKDRLGPRATLEQLLGGSFGGAAWNGKVQQAGVRKGRSLKCLAQTRQLIYNDSFRFRTGGRVERQRLSAGRNDRRGHRLVVDRAPVDK